MDAFKILGGEKMKGLLMSMAGFVLMLGAAGASDSDVSLGKVIAVLLIGFVLFGGGGLVMRMEDR